MNDSIARYQDEVEANLIASAAVTAYQILRREITPNEGKLRVKATLSDGGVAELFEYVVESGGQIVVKKYSFHWQDAHGKLVKRWDNAPHHNEVATAPHHLHHADETVTASDITMDILRAIEEIEKGILK